jgi:16S rRNA (cytosine967-C5)-methyltransferase
VLGGQHFAPFAADEIADGRERAFANRLVTAALRRWGHLDLVLETLLDRGLPKKAPRFEAVLRLALAELLFLPQAADHAATHLAVESVKANPRTRHLAGLANATLRAAQGRRETFSALDPLLALPAPVRARWQPVYGDAALAAFAEALLAAPPLDLSLKAPGPELAALPGAVVLPGPALRLFERDAPVESLPGFAEGNFWVQDAAAAIPARLVDFPPGARILDLCAAPGGKTAQLCAAGHDVTALDADGTRLTRLAANMQRLGFSPRVVEADALAFTDPEPFDAVLLDAPCSATGTFRRHPEVLHQHGPADIAGRAALQRRLIAHAASLLRPGGTLVYCVCSLEPEEGEAQAEWIAANLPDLVPGPVAPAELPGLEAPITPAGFVRTHPGLSPSGAEGGMDGFFVARFRRHPQP